MEKSFNAPLKLIFEYNLHIYLRNWRNSLALRQSPKDTLIY